MLHRAFIHGIRTWRLGLGVVHVQGQRGVDYFFLFFFFMYHGVLSMTRNFAIDMHIHHRIHSVKTF